MFKLYSIWYFTPGTYNCTLKKKSNWFYQTKVSRNFIDSSSTATMLSRSGIEIRITNVKENNISAHFLLYLQPKNEGHRTIWEHKWNIWSVCFNEHSPKISSSCIDRRDSWTWNSLDNKKQEAQSYNTVQTHETLFKIFFCMKTFSHSHTFYCNQSIFTTINTKHNFGPENRHDTNIRSTEQVTTNQKSMAAAVKGLSGASLLGV